MARSHISKMISVASILALLFAVFLCEGSRMDIQKLRSNFEALKERLVFDRPTLGSDQTAVDPQAQVWNSHGNRLAIVLPFTPKDWPLLKRRIASWNDVGSACTRPLFGDPKRVEIDVVFWYNLDLDSDPRLSQDLASTVLQDLANMKECLTQIKFLSANLKIEEDTYPGGVSMMWYKLFLDDVPGFTGKYDYFFWMEHDVQPVRSLWMDKLYQEVSTAEFFIKGSIFRGNALDRGITDPQKRAWIPHINGNALYRLGNRAFNALVNQAKSRLPEIGWHSFDTAIWQVLTNFSSSWKQYQTQAHMILYSDFIQNWGVDLRDDMVEGIQLASPNTFFIHGGRNSAALSQIQHSQPTDIFPPNDLEFSSTRRIGVVIPFPEKQIPSVVKALELWTTGDQSPCSPNLEILRLELVFLLDRPWTQHSGEQVEKVLDTQKIIRSCFGSVLFLTQPDRRKPIHTSDEFSGGNSVFFGIFTNVKLTSRYQYFLLLRPDTQPIRSHWLDRLIVQVDTPDDFWVKGSIYRGLRKEWRQSDIDNTGVCPSWASFNGNAIYKLNDRSFNKFLKYLVRSIGPSVPYGMAMHKAINDFSNFNQIHHKFISSPFLQSMSGAQHSPAELAAQFPETYLVHTCHPSSSEHKVRYNHI